MDFHCHVDLYPNPREVYAEAIRRNLFTWLVTTSPKAFVATSRALPVSQKVLISPGLHPELVGDRAGELDMLLAQIGPAKAVGEVGLDGSPKFRSSYAEQRAAFRATLARCASLGGRVLSIHSRQAATDVLAETQACPDAGVAVLHWFSGTKRELKVAANQGCWFSVGPAMLSAKSGYLAAGAMPRDRVVPESDGPFARVKGAPVMPWSMRSTAEILGPAWQMSIDDVYAKLQENSMRLIKLIDVSAASVSSGAFV
jgi:TatD DNase family protein